MAARIEERSAATFTGNAFTGHRTRLLMQRMCRPRRTGALYSSRSALSGSI